MNKYQKAIDRIDESRINKNKTIDVLDILILQELVDQTKTPTKEEIIKEWEALGYKWLDGKNCLDLFKEDEVRLGFGKTISISFSKKHYSAVYEENMYDGECYTCVPCDITFQEHQLLTKTFKMLGWE